MAYYIQVQIASQRHVNVDTHAEDQDAFIMSQCVRNWQQARGQVTHSLWSVPYARMARHAFSACDCDTSDMIESRAGGFQE